MNQHVYNEDTFKISILSLIFLGKKILYGNLGYHIMRKIDSMF